MLSKVVQLFSLLILLTLPSLTIAGTKPAIILMPIELSDQDLSLESVLGPALQNGLSERYQVYYGQAVEAVLESEFEKVECTAESCMLALAVEFNTSFIADAAVKQIGSGYIAKLVIRDVVDRRVIDSQAVPCEGCNQFDLLSLLKRLGAGQLTTGQETNEVPKESKLDRLIADANNLLIGLDLTLKRIDRAYQLYVEAKAVSDSDSRITQLQQDLATAYRAAGAELADQEELEMAKIALEKSLSLEEHQETAELISELSTDLEGREARNRTKRLVRRVL